MANHKYSEDDLKRILAETEAELAPVLKAEAERMTRLAKEETPEGTPDDSPSAPPHDESAESPGGDGSAPPPGPPSAPPPGPDASASAPPSPSPGGALPSDPAQLAEMVAQLPPEQQEALYLAAKQAIFAREGAAGAPPSPSAPDAAGASAPPSPAGPPPGPPAGGPPMPPPGPPALKAEMQSSPANGTASKPRAGALGKTEQSRDQVIADLRKSLADERAKREAAEKSASSDPAVKAIGEKVELLAKAMTAIMGKPQRKALTSLPSAVVPLAKSEAGEVQLSKSEVKDRLNAVAANPKLSKADRKRISQYYDGHCQNYALVKDLIDAAA
jgi:hypothetical protein